MGTLDLSLFIKHPEDKITIGLVYIDSLILTKDLGQEIQQTRDNLLVRFQIKELRELKRFLGPKQEKMKEGLFLY